jgi:hypothetical protein
MWEFYTPKIQILEFFPHTGEGWEEASSMERRLILPDLNDPLCLNERCGPKSSQVSCKTGGKRIHFEKNNEGKSKHAVKSAKRLNEEKTPEGKSVNAIKGGKAAHHKRDANGKSLIGLQAKERLHSNRNEDGKSLVGVLAAQRLQSNRWRCLVTGKVTMGGALTLWQRARGIDPSNRVKVTNKEDS